MKSTLRKMSAAAVCCLTMSGCQTASPHLAQSKSASLVSSKLSDQGNAQANATRARTTDAARLAQAEQVASQRPSGPQSPVAPASYTQPEVAPAGFVAPVVPGRIPMAHGHRAHSQHAHQGGDCPSCNKSQTYCPVYTDLGEGCPPPSAGDNTRWIDPQEYVFDGGDREPWVVVQTDGNVAGLQPEDTVIHYERYNGNVYVHPACRVPIYAPRFGSVRKITTLRESDLAISPLAANQPVAANTAREALPPLKVRQPVKAMPETGVRVVEAFRDRNRGIPIERTIPPLGFEDALLPYADIQFLRTGQKIETDIVKLQRGVEAARAWASEESIQVIIDGQEAAIIKDEKTTAETVLYDYQGKPCVRICKVASHQIAEPGDEVEFTIRFDNSGVEAVENVVILDSLAPRLEYVEGSQKTSLASRFSTSDNEAGSSILRWELEKPLGAGEGGFIRFRCLVR